MAENKKTDRHLNPRLAFHLPPDLLAALQDYIASLGRLAPDKSKVGRVALEEFLARAGFWPRGKGKKGAG